MTMATTTKLIVAAAAAVGAYAGLSAYVTAEPARPITRPVAVQARTAPAAVAAPATARLEAAAPGTAASGATVPGAAASGTAGRGATVSGTAGLGAAASGAAAPATVGVGAVAPGAVGPGAAVLGKVSVTRMPDRAACDPAYLARSVLDPKPGSTLLYRWRLARWNPAERRWASYLTEHAGFGGVRRTVEWDARIPGNPGWYRVELTVKGGETIRSARFRASC
ncbi:hypothetical protein [Nonomuraea longicatena]|uniref:Uncharacterized protein n=1 Tax=Nonomuraea longicatena TaxID=83682 RepID=A0ABN1NRG0_9ACTN